MTETCIDAAVDRNPPGARDDAHELLRIPEDTSSEKQQLLDSQRAVLNILEDFGEERRRQEDTERATLNILEDFADEKARLEEMQRAVLNILDDLATEKDRLETARRQLERSEQAVRASLLEKEALLKEIHHRVKNNLQVIGSLLRLQSRYIREEPVRAMFEESQKRVHSISLVHEMLYRAPDLARVDFEDYLRTLTGRLAEGWRGAGPAIQIEVEAAGVQLAVDKAIPCGLIVNELVTNALKHAFPGAGYGSIRVSLVETQGGGLTLTVQDDGVGLPEDFDLERSRSLGLELVTTLVRQIHATVAIRRHPGTTFEISLPGTSQ